MEYLRSIFTISYGGTLLLKVISTPQILYHGTTESAVSSFKEKLLNPTYWRPGRDFGEGLYTTTSISQARKWAHRAGKSSVPVSRPCVLEILLSGVPLRYVPQMFLGISASWGKYIFEHRLVKDKGEDPCERHADLIIGPMADNDTGKIVQEALSLNQDHHWFYQRIIRSVKGRRLDVLSLGNQVVFSSETWEPFLQLSGYFIYSKGRWIYHEHASSAESI